MFDAVITKTPLSSVRPIITSSWQHDLDLQGSYQIIAWTPSYLDPRFEQESEKQNHETNEQ